MKLYRYVYIALIFAVLGAACGTIRTVPKLTPMPALRPMCDVTLWRHVYHPQRLQILGDCIRVSGHVLSILQERDGDAHIIVRLDVPLGSKQTIVAEIICVYHVLQSDALQACSGFHNTIKIPVIRSHVDIVGSHVLDTVHNWEEIHPVTSVMVRKY